MINLYEYKKIDGVLEREVVETLQKNDISTVTGTVENLANIIKINDRYDFYINIQPIEERWYSLIKEKNSILSEIKEVHKEFLQAKEEEKRHLEMRLYKLFGESHEDTVINEEGYENSDLKRVNDEIKKLENKYIWLGDFDKKPIFNPLDIKQSDKKNIISKVRDQKVRSLEDTVADLSKMNTLLMSFITSIYGTLSETNKGKIPEENKALIDFAVEKWPETQTRGDRQLQAEGTDLITKLFEREVQIADIIDEVKNVNGLDVKEEA